jgi:putative ABC transport system permease protein
LELLTAETLGIHRDMPHLTQATRDLRFAARQLLKSPVFAVTSILTLAFSLGGITALFSLLNALLIRPLPVPHAEELAIISSRRSNAAQSSYGFSAPVFRALEKRHDVFQGVAAYSIGDFQMRGPSGTFKVTGAIVSGEFFETMQVQPLLGRPLTPQDDQPRGAGGFAVVVSESFWRTWFNAAPDVVGRRITIANAPFTVAGVMPRSFFGADPTARPELYAPIWAEPIIDPPYNNIAARNQSIWLHIIARRKPAISLDKARAALLIETRSVVDEAVTEPRLRADMLARQYQILAESGSRGYADLRSLVRKPLVAVFALCAAMLVLTCVNLASLLMARSFARERELATRLAVGASRRRLIEQLLVESLLITMLGAGAGLIAAPLASRWLGTFLVGNSPAVTLDAGLDFYALAFVTLTAILSSFGIGLLPALRITGTDLSGQMKSGFHPIVRVENRLAPRILLGLEVALTLTLVTGAGLLAKSLARLNHTGLGFEPTGVINLNLDMDKQGRNGDTLVEWYRSYADAIRNLPGVRGVAYASYTPLSGSTWTTVLETPWSMGQHNVYMNTVGPSFFATMRIPIFTGRDFTWDDSPRTTRKIVLSQSAARALFPGQTALGKGLTIDRVSYEIIGIVGDIHYASVRDDMLADAYVAITQRDDRTPSYTAVVRVEGSPAPVAGAVRQLTIKMAPDIPTPVMTTLDSDLESSIGSERMMAMLAGFFAICALVITTIGLYGTLASMTTRRTNEIGIRMALGAQRAQVAFLVFRENLLVVAGGTVAGLAVALLALRALGSFLYATSVRDPWTFVCSVVAIAAVATAASMLPALRAARVTPTKALRAQ